MFLKSRSQSSTSGKLPRLEPTSTVRTASLFWRKKSKLLFWFGNGLLLPSSLHSTLCLRSTGTGAPRTRTTGASFRSKEWAFGPFLASLLASLLALFLLISCCFLAYFLLFRQTRHSSLVPRSLLLIRQTCLFLQIGDGITSFIIVARAAHSTLYLHTCRCGRYRHARLYRIEWHAEILPATFVLSTRGTAVMSVLTRC